MFNPVHARPLALEIAGVSRSLPLADNAQAVPVPDGQLRVLMVVSRPAGTGDVGYRMIARPLLERLEALRGSVDLAVLRPPSLEALREELEAAAAAGKPYQVVHFDGHGVMLGGEGTLVFERPGGGAHYVPAAEIANVLGDARIPVAVLNACQSGAVSKELEAAVATALLKAGVASVVAMAYTVYAVAAAEFMMAFYDRLFGGGTVSSAVTAGRRQMYSNPGRPSPKGDLALMDWLVPVHYLRRDVSFLQAVNKRRIGPSTLTEALDTHHVRNETGAASAEDVSNLDAVDGLFVGRDALFYELEGASRLAKVVVLAGPGGIGKTELAKAFGRWWRDTGGVEDPSFVFWHSFEPGVATFGLDGVIGGIGRRVWGEEFSLKETGQQRELVMDLLKEHRALLIWDNFESVCSMPDPGQATPPLDQNGRGELIGFLGSLDGGSSAVLITSRTSEDWLGNIHRIDVGGLARHEAVQYADALLAQYPSARRRREDRAFGDLMEWLEGHPLSMHLILPHLANTDPLPLMDALRGTASLPSEIAEVGRIDSLTASIAYSYIHLTESTRRLLPAISLFYSIADIAVLYLFSSAQMAPQRFVGATAEDWISALNDASSVGLLSHISRGMYRMHPALPRYLSVAWRAEDSEDYIATRDCASRALAEATAGFCEYLDSEIGSGDATFAFTVMGLQRRTLGSLLGYALDHQLWEEAQAIVQPLDKYWSASGLDAEADAWTERVYLALEDPDGGPPPPDSPAGTLWMFIMGTEANRNLIRHRFTDAEQAFRQILAAVQSQEPTTEKDRGLAVSYHQLGRVTQDQGRFDEAEEWFRKSLKIKEDLQDQQGMPDAYHQLGRIAQQLERLGEAEEWYRKSLTISRELGDLPALARAYAELGLVAVARGQYDAAETWYRNSWRIHKDLQDQRGLSLISYQLGLVAQAQGRLGEAKEWLRRALTISETLGDFPTIASIYALLGLVAQDEDRLNEAEEWLRKSLSITEDVGDLQGAADDCYSLGLIIQDQGRLGEAEEWYRKALGLSEDLQDQSIMVLSYGQLGVLAEDQGHVLDALTWTVRCVALLNQLSHPPLKLGLDQPLEVGLDQLARLVAQADLGVLEESWRIETGQELSDTVRAQIGKRLSGKRLE